MDALEKNALVVPDDEGYRTDDSKYTPVVGSVHSLETFQMQSLHVLQLLAI